MNSPYAKFKRKYFPKTYARQGLQRAERTYDQRIRAAPLEKRAQLRYDLSYELWEWRDWLQEIEDAELIAKLGRWMST